MAMEDDSAPSPFPQGRDSWEEKAIFSMMEFITQLKADGKVGVEKAGSLGMLALRRSCARARRSPARSLPH